MYSNWPGCCAESFTDVCWWQNPTTTVLPANPLPLTWRITAPLPWKPCEDKVSRTNHIFIFFGITYHWLQSVFLPVLFVFSLPPLFLNNISQLVFLQVYAEQVPCKPRKLKLWGRCELLRYPEGQPAEPPASELWAVLLGLTRACIKAEDQESQYLLRFKQNLEAQRGDTLERKHSSPITTEKFPVEKLWDK